MKKNICIANYRVKCIASLCEKNIDIQQKSGEQVAKYKKVFMKYMYVYSDSELAKKANTKNAAGIQVVHLYKGRSPKWKH